jgi:hypothetical protein
MNEFHKTHEIILFYIVPDDTRFTGRYALHCCTATQLTQKTRMDDKPPTRLLRNDKIKKTVG